MKNMFEIYIRECLKDDGIDIEKDNYYCEPAFAKYYEEYVLGGECLSMTCAWYIEKYIVGQERLKKIYGSIYALGIEHNFTEEDLSWESLFKEISDWTCEDIKDIEKNIMRPDGGLLVRLVDTLNFGVQEFEDDQVSRLKLLYLIYNFERDYKMELMSLLKKPTLENVDNSMVGKQTKNGHITAKLKNEVMKEVPPQFIKNTKETLLKIILDWSSQIKKAMIYLYLSENIDYTYDIQRIKDYLEDLVRKLNLEHENVDYKHSLLETFYLKLLQHENLGRENDIIDVNKTISISSEDNVNEEYIKKMKVLMNELISYDKLSEYLLEIENRKRIAQIVYNTDKVNSNQLRKVKDSIEHVKVLLSMIEENTSISFLHGVPFLVIISCLQEIIKLKKTDILENNYYHYKNSPTMYTELINGNCAHTKSQIAWVTKVLNRINCNKGYGKQTEIVRKIELLLDKIIKKILEYPNIDDMLFLHTDLMKRIDREMISLSEARSMKIEFQEKLIKATGYGLDVYNDQNYVFFKEIKTSVIDDQIINELAKHIKNVEKGISYDEIRIPFELITEDNILKNEFYVDFTVYQAYNKVVLNRFNCEYPKDYYNRIKELGLLAIIK